MKRDMDLAREILLELEDADSEVGWVDLAISGHSADEISYHIRLLADAGLVEAVDLSSHDGVDWRPQSLTWAGHEFLDAARNDTVWSRAKALIAEKGGGATLDVIKVVLFEVAKRHLRGG